MNQKRPLTLTLFLLRLLSGIAGGVMGTLALFIVFFLTSPVVPQTEEITSISIFIIIVMTFVGTLTANTTTALAVTFMDNEKYSRRKTIFLHVFIFNLVLFLVTIPLYILGISHSPDLAIGIAALHLLLSAFVSALIMEVISGAQYSLLGVYSSALGAFISIGLGLFALTLDIQNTVLLL